MSKRAYLGDSVYAEIENGMLKLTTWNGYEDDPRNVIYMEPEVIAAFQSYLKSFTEPTRPEDLEFRDEN